MSSIYTTVKFITDELSDMELAILNNVINFPDYDVTSLEFYDKVKPLFTKENGKKMHAEVQNMLDIEVIRRLETK